MNRRNDNGIEIRCFGARHEIIAHKLSPIECGERKRNQQQQQNEIPIHMR